MYGSKRFEAPNAIYQRGGLYGDGLIDSDREPLAYLVRTSARGMAAEEETEPDVPG